MTAVAQHLSPTIVAGLSRSAADQDILAAAIAQARALQGRLVVIHALPIAHPAGSLASDREDHRRHVAADIRRAVEKQFTNGHPDIPCEIIVNWGGAATMLLASASNAAMLVVGTHDTAHQAPLLLGTVSQDVAVHSPRPVLLIPVPRAV
ncbi:universal stress protein [Catelliglobosispora koreensis]|uniref:universal stress protein n=1 Tax=Catelliglobosispora koreensis TaxID=129052 RepID=UPI00035D0B76|nr:universal stress protein [Catelliglobosispora koreensis]